MDERCGQLTVFFAEPFWVGVFERVEGDGLSACKVTFGAEPKDSDVLAYVQKHYRELEFSAPVPLEARARADNPKRRQRAAAREMQPTGVGTKSQQALQAQRDGAQADHQGRAGGRGAAPLRAQAAEEEGEEAGPLIGQPVL